MNADAHLHLVLAERECRRPGRRNGAAGQSHPHRAGPGIDPLAQRRTAFEIYAPLGGGADDLLDNERAGHAAAASAVGRALDGDIVIGDDGGGAALRELGGHLEIHAVPGIVLDDEEDPGLARDRLRRLDDLIGRRGGEDLARTGGVEHAIAYESGVQRFVTAAAARDERHFVRVQLAAPQKLPFRPENDDIGVRGGEAVEALGNDRLGRIDELLHGAYLSS